MVLVEEEHQYEKSPVATLVDLEKAISKIGTVKGVDPQAQTVEGRVEHGFDANTRVKARAQREGDTSIIHFESKVEMSLVEQLVRTWNVCSKKLDKPTTPISRLPEPV